MRENSWTVKSRGHGDITAPRHLQRSAYPHASMPQCRPAPIDCCSQPLKHEPTICITVLKELKVFYTSGRPYVPQSCTHARPPERLRLHAQTSEYLRRPSSWVTLCSL
ncbi:uncharacterized protein LOC143040528 isoform X1 [Oratosquilla oratoria]|uniref:uncharacterized protein LOC143040528 isoform X1 n=1 Tax=Oratosquilla oratoria TaxID=337810 RepID=UPI003F763609